MSSPQQQQHRQQHRRQIMQPWPLCLANFGRAKDRAILPKGYSRAASIARASSVRLVQDCSSNSTLLTQLEVSPFNSRVGLEPEQPRQQQQHYYADNLRSNRHQALNCSQIYDPSGGAHACKQLQPLLGDDQRQQPSCEARALMEPQLSGKPAGPAPPRNVAQFQKETRRRRPYYFSQVLAAFAVSIGSMVVGFASSYTSPALVSMKKDDDLPFQVTHTLQSWIGSIMPLSALFGGLAGGAMIEYLGRRNTILSLSLPFFLSWLLIGYSVNVSMVLIGRAVSGFCVGMLTLAMPVYLGETMKPEVRGTLGLMPTAFGNVGILLCNGLGIWLNWWQLALGSALIPVPFAVLMMLVPETPRWYIAKGQAKRARRSLQWLRGRGADVSEELASTEKMHAESERQASQRQSDLGELLRKANLRPLAISLGLMFFQQMSGINAVIFYTNSIFQEALPTKPANASEPLPTELPGAPQLLSEDQRSTLVVAVVNFVATFLAAAVIDRAGRKLLLYVSSLSMIASLAALGGFFYLKDRGHDVEAIRWLPLVCLVVYVLGFSLGFGPVPWLMMGEILPAKVRGPAASLVTSFNWSCTFLVTKEFSDLILLIGASGTFWLFGLVCVCGLFFVLLFVPETSGRSLEEIERGLAGRAVRRMSSVANMKPTPMAC